MGENWETKFCSFLLCQSFSRYLALKFLKIQKSFKNSFFIYSYWISGTNMVDFNSIKSNYLWIWWMIFHMFEKSSFGLFGDWKCEFKLRGTGGDNPPKYSTDWFFILIVVFRLQVVNALHYLHSKLNVIHRDVKPSNILINRTGEVKMCDFGISGQLVDSVAKTIDAGCKPYMAVRLSGILSFCRISTRLIIYSRVHFYSKNWSHSLLLFNFFIFAPYPSTAK